MCTVISMILAGVFCLIFSVASVAFLKAGIDYVVVQGRGEGWMEPLPGVFDRLQYFETMLPLVENLCSS